MGTNYYIECTCCGTRLFHIGKQSAGWDFLANITKDEFIKRIIQEKKVIRNEYGEEITKQQLLERVTDNWRLHSDAEKWFEAGDNGWS